MVSKTPPPHLMSADDRERLASLPAQVDEEPHEDEYAGCLDDVADTEVSYHDVRLPTGKKVRLRSITMGEHLGLQELDSTEARIREIMKLFVVDGKGRRWLTDDQFETWKKRDSKNFTIILRNIENRFLPDSDLEGMAEEAAKN